LDILFSDHRMPVETLEEFGDVIREINKACDDDEAQFWTFIAYISQNHNELLSAVPPAELQPRVDRLLAATTLPPVELKLKELPADDGPPPVTVELPQDLFERYAAANRFFAIAAVQVRDRNGQIHSATLIDDNGPLLLCPNGSSLIADNIAAIRGAPGCLFGWFVRPKWIERTETE
jgi:hypothetical protein